MNNKIILRVAVYITFFVFLFSCNNISKKADNTEKILKVACVGNSITYGFGIEDRDSLSYPAQLQRLLGEKWEVKNFGINSRTLMKSGDLPYINEQIFTDAKDFLPDYVIIKLGTNDTKPHNWEYKNEFIEDYKNLIKEFQQLESSPIVILVKAVPAFPDRWGITDSIIVNELNPLIEETAKEMNLTFVDMHTIFVGKNELFPDKIHPNETGALVMAENIYNVLIKN